MKKIGVLLPAYNEEKNIQIVIKEAKKFLPNSRIVVVDDGSKDKTYELAKRTGVEVIRHDVNKGKGEALRTGFEYFLKKCPDTDLMIVADTDRQYRLDDAPKFLDIFQTEKVDFITGYRRPSDMPYANRLGNIIWRKIFNILFKTNLKDSNCGFIALNKKAIKIVRNSAYGGYIIDNAIRIDVIKHKLKIGQVYVKVFYGKRKITKFARMFFGNLIFILVEGFKYRLDIK
jgi:glycosyltransferase involved in cell wall biosynthesis